MALRVTPANVAPTPTDRAAAAEAQQVQTTDPLPEIRKQAEQYRNALLALTTLVSAAWVVTGATAAGDLTPGRRIVVGTCLGTAFSLLIIGSVASMSAAYGSLKGVTLLTSKSMQEFRANECKRTLRVTRLSRVVIVLAVILLGAAVATAFFNPKPLTSPLIKISTKDAMICGTLKGGNAQTINVETISDSGQDVTNQISLSDLLAMRPVAEC